MAGVETAGVETAGAEVAGPVVPGVPGAPDAVTAATVGGLRWSLLNTVFTRSVSVASGVVVARILVPADFGVFAVGFLVVTVLLGVNDLGVTPAIVREGADVGRIAPTVTTLAWGTSALLVFLFSSLRPRHPFFPISRHVS